MIMVLALCGLTGSVGFLRQRDAWPGCACFSFHGWVGLWEGVL